MADSISFRCGMPCKKNTGVAERILLYPDCLQTKEIYMLSATFSYERIDRIVLLNIENVVILRPRQAAY